ncbi:MAG: hypothetical protein N2248_03255 [candidate division WOR-3 bacterium]|nr:hypothetical protein [candidate division WOR-3 bacterium]
MTGSTHGYQRRPGKRIIIPENLPDITKLNDIPFIDYSGLLIKTAVVILREKTCVARRALQQTQKCQRIFYLLNAVQIRIQTGNNQPEPRQC